MALLGVVCPSTLGIDSRRPTTRKRNARRKGDTLDPDKDRGRSERAWPQLVQAAITAADNMAGKAPRRVEATVTFGEYASPSF
jgi:hypothetical protein